MTDLIELSSRVIDEGLLDVVVNRTSGELSELADELAIVESFSHCVAWSTAEGLVCFDASAFHTGRTVVDSLRSWRTDRVSNLVYTHGHVDHVGGSGFFAADATDRGFDAPTVVGHDNVARRFDRYDYTAGYNTAINQRQFGGLGGQLSLTSGAGEEGVAVAANPQARRFLPRTTLRPDVTFDTEHTIRFGDTELVLKHAKGETDDHLWAWVPERRWAFVGDFLIWNFPNAGNPQKVQRFPIEWAAALRDMAAHGPELLVPAHGLPIAGTDRISRVLDDVATALENLVRDVVAMMNAGATLDTIVHTVTVPADTLAKPYLRPLYDEPEFVVRGIWRQFGGWWDLTPSRLKPSPDAHLAREIAALVGGADVLMERARRASAEGDHRLAGHFADLAGWAEPDSPSIHGERAEIYLTRRKAETSLMAKGVFLSAARESQAVVDAHAGDTGRAD